MANACEKYSINNNTGSIKRMRIYFNIIYRNKKAAMDAEKSGLKIIGVNYFKANPITGNLLILFDSSVTDEYTIKKQIYRNSSGGFYNIPARDTKNINRDYLKLAPKNQEESANQSTFHEAAYSGNHHAYKIHEVEKQFTTNGRHGLSNEQALIKLKEAGYNVISEAKRKSLLKRIFENLNEFSTKMLVGAGLLSTFLGQIVEGIAVLGIAAAETVLSTIQQHRADKSLYSLKKMMIANACIIRDGKKRVIDARYLVPGDVILVEAGGRVPADARLIDCCDLKISEAMLTGESAPVCKNSNLCGKNTELAERNNMIYMGTTILSGRGKAIVTATGKNTEIGKIADMLQNIKNECAPIQTKIKKFTAKITKLSLMVCLGLSVLRLFQGAPFVSVIILGISFAVGAIPESLPALVTAAMARSIQKMAKKNAIVRKLPSVETLGAANVICCDKTGTLTMNEMTVKEIFTNGSTYELTGSGYNPHGEFLLKSGNNNAMKGLDKLLTAGVLCNNSSISKCEDKWTVQGDPTEGALITAACKYAPKFRKLPDLYRRSKEIPFDSSRGYMTVLVSSKEGKYAYSKGSFSKIINKCTSIYDNGEKRLFTSTDKEKIEAIAVNMGQRALRVLAFAYKDITNDKDNIEINYTFLGMAGMEDPPRDEVRDCIKKCHKAGIKVVMITGDNKNTASSIGKNIGLLTDGIVLTGTELEAMADDDLYKIINHVQIFARTSPEQKLKIVKAFKRAGNVVAMTGDGVNDAPAIKEADIGIAMGVNGSDVARDTADIILTDDNFCTIVAAIEEGRNVNNNIKNSLKYLLSGCLSEMIAIGAATLITGISPLVSMQILLINVIAETILGSSLTLEAPSKNIMKSSPISKNDDILDKKLTKQVVRRGIVTGLATLGIFHGSLLTGASLKKARTLAFTGIILSQIVNLYRCKSNRKSVNKYMNIASVACLLLLIGIIYIPFISTYFLTSPLLLRDIILLSGTTALTMI